MAFPVNWINFKSPFYVALVAMSNVEISCVSPCYSGKGIGEHWIRTGWSRQTWIWLSHFDYVSMNAGSGVREGNHSLVSF